MKPILKDPIFWWSVVVPTLTLIIAAGVLAWLIKGGEEERRERVRAAVVQLAEAMKEDRDKECRVLAAIGVKAGDNITIYGDMPTWKIACLMGDGDD